VQDRDFSYDQRLVERAREGDDRAARELVERHQERVYRLAYRLCGDADAAQDISQDVFLRLLRNLRRLDDGRALFRWLTRTTTNVVRDRWRTRRETVEFDEGLHDDPHGAQGRRPGPGEEAAQAQMGERIQRALTDLPHRYREAFVLRHVEEMSHEEMCDELGLGLSAVKVRIHRACRMLRELLPEYVDD
jgi:RNA polymerase sigma-70 factor (ECF subfamily)